ncbi:hypothetical protein QN277_027533 [Acacia crassicarpa]|uniref:Xyloglucan endotransglucosylase/hydrolase n=1 Tax=Acacia crassicarpa TaxID=499986 RepID=A0AAE1JBP9_9FABA|nr:hypothetical protein QN277_027533 [Acacia crassicarpa]
MSTTAPSLAFSLLLTCSLLFISASADSFYQNFYVTWGGERSQVLQNGDLLTLSLDNSSGSGFESINEYLFARIDMQIKLVPGNSAGTVTSFFLSSQGQSHDEIDFEFLGNLSGDPYILHTNIYCQGQGNREQQFYLWFDPTADFHNYTVLWGPQLILFLVDGIPIREFKNLESSGIPYPKSQAMRVYSSLWNADDWATRGGLVKTDWSQAPFIASYKGFRVRGCVWLSGNSNCNSDSEVNTWMWQQQLDYAGQGQVQWVQNNFMIYNYCSDFKRFPQGFPQECYLTHNT